MVPCVRLGLMVAIADYSPIVASAKSLKDDQLRQVEAIASMPLESALEMVGRILIPLAPSTVIGFSTS